MSRRVTERKEFGERYMMEAPLDDSPIVDKYVQKSGRGEVEDCVGFAEK